jgi:uroporphyrinogen-III synthase
MRSIPDVLQGTATVDELVVYRTDDVLPDPSIVKDIAHRIDSGEIDWGCFFSPSAVEAFEKLFGAAYVTGFKTAVIGPTTARRAAELGFDVAFLSPVANAEEFARAFAVQVKQ